MSNTQWVKYDGSDKQIAEMKASRDVIIRFKSSYELLRSSCFVDDFNDRLAYGTVTHYLICNPHPYADMICQWARTGQQVWVKTTCIGYRPCEFGGDEMYSKPLIYSTTTPNWNIQGAEYSFTEFKEDV